MNTCVAPIHLIYPARMIVLITIVINNCAAQSVLAVDWQQQSAGVVHTAQFEFYPGWSVGAIDLDWNTDLGVRQQQYNEH